jgi:Ca-activated chloride channel family protein
MKIRITVVCLLAVLLFSGCGREAPPEPAPEPPASSEGSFTVEEVLAEKRMDRGVEPRRRADARASAPTILLQEEVENSKSIVDAYGVGGGAAGAYGTRWGYRPMKRGGGVQRSGFAGHAGSPEESLLVIERRKKAVGNRTPAVRLFEKPEEKSEVPEGYQATQGSLLRRDPGGETLGDFPLEHTDVRTEISGFLASTVVRQTFTNPYPDVIEAVYVFPLPTSAAVNDFLMEIGDRRIRGIIRPREEAQRLYEEARARGQTASLLTQERDNVFTQNVANIEAGGEVVIHITYFHTLAYEKGTYEYVFPMVVGPRYTPGGGGTTPNTDEVPDASRVTPPVLREGERSGHDISVLVDVDAGTPIREVSVPTHDVHIEHVGLTRSIVRLSEADSIPNRDFIVRYRVAGDAPGVGILAHRGESGGFFTLMLVPQLDPRDADVTPREVTFILDTSGSMEGIPLETSKAVVRRALRTLRPGDRFNIIRFAGDTEMLFPAPVENSEENVRKGMDYLEGMRGAGGTEMIRGLDAYLQTARDPACIRIVCFLTDGFVTNDDGILRMVKEEGQDARWFAFGIGSSVNRYLIGGIGKYGNGAAHFVIPRDEDHAEKAAATFQERIDAPVLVDIAVDYGDLPIADVYPERIPDLFTGQPIVLKGRYTKAAEGTIRVIGRVGDRTVTIPVDVELAGVERRNEALGPVWARQRIADLSGDLISNPDDEDVIQRITNLALEFRLVSAYTSFVAVNADRIVGDGKPIKILVPVEIPEDVSREGAVGVEPMGQAVRATGWGMVLMEFADGSVRVVRAQGGSPVSVGDRLVSVNRTQIRGIRHLESLLLQTTGERIEVGFRPGDDPHGAVTHLDLPQP